MAFLIAAVIAVAVPLALQRGEVREPFREAGVCGRCHVISVVEWGMSGHLRASTGCTACHGASLGHVQDERNNVKPDRLPKQAAIAGFCRDCHKDGCAKSGQTSGCQNCHHYHALVDPRKPVSATVTYITRESESHWREYSRLMEQGEKLAQAGQWQAALAAFEEARKHNAGDRRVGDKIRHCKRRLKPDLPGFDIIGQDFDPATGLARRVRVTEVAIQMVLVRGGEFEIGSERFAAAKPVHTVSVAPFYLGRFEITQAEWSKVMGANPSAHQGAFPNAGSLPVEQVSWEDSQAFIRKLNQTIPGGSFRLPTEAEWEFAARTGESQSQGAAGGQSPRPAGRGGPNRLGLYDMLGNVWEWCSSLSRPYPFDATDGRESPNSAGLRILRGGGFADPFDLHDPALRHAERPDRRFRWNGLRLARDVPEAR
jgi:formylglycine-generating enzyme required for sulfatase activity